MQLIQEIRNIYSKTHATNEEAIGLRGNQGIESPTWHEWVEHKNSKPQSGEMMQPTTFEFTSNPDTKEDLNNQAKGVPH